MAESPRRRTKAKKAPRVSAERFFCIGSGHGRASIGDYLIVLGEKIGGIAINRDCTRLTQR